MTDGSLPQAGGIMNAVAIISHQSTLMITDSRQRISLGFAQLHTYLAVLSQGSPGRPSECFPALWSLR